MLSAALIPTARHGRRRPGDGDGGPGDGRLGRWLGGLSPALAFLILLIISLAIGFVATFILLDRLAAIHPGVRGALDLRLLPIPLWLPTAVLLGSSVSLAIATRAVRRAGYETMRRALVIAFLLGMLFLLLQLVNFSVAAERFRATQALDVKAFYVLVAMHGAHLIGGLAPLAFVTVRSLLGWYSAQRWEGMRYCAIYWHFLDAVWLAIVGWLVFVVPKP